MRFVAGPFRGCVDGVEGETRVQQFAYNLLAFHDKQSRSFAVFLFAQGAQVLEFGLS